MSKLNNQENEQDYLILNDKITYDIDKFNINKHLTYDVLTKEQMNKQERFYQYRTVIKLKDIIEDFSPYTINVLCKPFKVSKGILIFKYTDKNSAFYNGEFDPKRMMIQFCIEKSNKISKLYHDLDKYFQSDEFKFNYFKDLGYNKNTTDNFYITYCPLFTHVDEDKDDDRFNHKYNYIKDKYKIKFGVDKNKQIITTKIIIKDNKSDRIKEYENLKFTDFKKIENLMSQKNISIQPLINIYNIYTTKLYTNTLTKPINDRRIHIHYGILTKMKELTFYTDKFDNVIHNIFEDNLDDIKYYEYNKIKKIEVVEENKEQIKENNDKEIEKVDEIKIEKTNDFKNNILNISIFSIILLLNDILLFYCYKNIF